MPIHLQKNPLTGLTKGLILPLFKYFKKRSVSHSILQEYIPRNSLYIIVFWCKYPATSLRAYMRQEGCDVEPKQNLQSMGKI